MPNLEPTYLRYVYDALNKGTLNAENAAVLPQGFIGLYEQEFTQKTPASEREKVLNQLVLWALFKGPVSANLAAAVLELEEEQMKDLVDTYSSWFNSPESGKYQLYHERLRVYLFQKLKSEEIKLLNEKIISEVKKALKRKTANDLQLYGLQFLGYHQLIETALNKSFEDFIKTCLDNKFIDRQIDVSNAFDWTKEPMKEALKLAAFNEDKNTVFELSKSLVNLNTKEKEGLGEIQNLLDDGKDELVITRLNSILDGTKENYTTSYAFQILSIAYLMDTHSSNDIEKRVGLFIENIENNIPDDPKIVDQFLLIPEHITIKLIVELYKAGLESEFILKRCSSINFSAKNLSTYNSKELKYLYELVKNYFKDDELDFLICVADQAIIDKNTNDYFLKKLEIELRKYIKEDNDIAYYHIQIPEEILRFTKNRYIINYCCENYLGLDKNKLSKKVYLNKFNFDTYNEFLSLLPLPSIDLLRIFNVDLIKPLLNKLNAEDFEYSLHDWVRRFLILLCSDDIDPGQIIKNFIEKFGAQNIGTNGIKEIYSDYLYNNDVDESNLKKIKIFIENSINNEDDRLNLLDIINHIKFKQVSKIDNKLKAKFFESEFIELIKKIDKHNDSFSEVILNIAKYIRVYNFPFECTELLLDITETDLTRKMIYIELLPILFKSSEFSQIDSIIKNEKKSFGSTFFRILSGLTSYSLCEIIDQNGESISIRFNVKLFCVNKLQLKNNHIDYLVILFYNLSKSLSNAEKFKRLSELVEVLHKNKYDFIDFNIEKTIINIIAKFNDLSWQLYAVKNYCEKFKIENIQVFRFYKNLLQTKSAIKSDDLNSFRLQSKLPDFKTISSKTIKRKVALHCIKNNFTDYFISNELHKENLFSDYELIKFSSIYINQNNIAIFNCLIDSLEDNYNQLAFKNELYFFLISKSLETSKISFDYDEYFDVIIKAIKSISDVNTLEILNNCINELDSLDDYVDFETGEVIERDEIKVESIYFIVTNLWKIGEKKLARKQLKSAFNFYNKMEFETEKETWIKKLDYLAITVLTKKDLEKYLKEKIQIQEALSFDIIDSVFKNNFSSIINEILTKDHIDRSVMRNMVNAYVKHHSLEKAFSFVKQIQNPVHSNAWRNVVLEKVYSIGNDFDGTVAFDKYDLVYNSVESTKALEQMLKYALFSDLSSESSIKQISSRYDGYLIESEVNQLVKNISNA
ncbi:MAG: hypothetical protein CL832_07660 [Crocinitomicaceae bacterium]|nr:hypothetical protein [Crocinitomicaceae bacterium]